MNTTATTTSPAVPVDLNDVKAFYLEHLVPVGQGLHLIARCYDVMRARMRCIGQFSNHPPFKRVGYQNYAALLLDEGFTPLHLVNCYLQSRRFIEGLQRGDRGLMPQLAIVLDEMRVALCQPIFLWVDNTHFGPDVSAESRAEIVGYPDNLTQLQQSTDIYRAAKRTGEMEDVILLLRTLHARLYEILGVTSATRQAWVVEHVNPHSPLTRDGRISIWRTLVNNLPWTAVAKTLHLKETPEVTWLGSPQGRNQVASLVAQAFTRTGYQNLPACPEGARVPTGVTFSSTADGYVLVEGRAASRSDEIVAQLGVDVRSLTGVSDNLRRWLNQPASRSVFKCRCSYGDLPEQVEEAGRAVASAARMTAAAIEELQAYAAKARQGHLLARLTKEFDESEMGEVAGLLRNLGF